MKFKNIDDLFRYIENDISDVLENDVADIVKADMSTAIQTGVYDRYDPEYYNRRKYNGGLISPENMEVTVEDNTLTVCNKTPLDNSSIHNEMLTDIVVNGRGNMPFPRDFIEETKTIIEVNNDHIEQIEQSLKKKGYKIR